ncbi:MAG: Mur ligase family protein [Candidatus Omnitrophica bacterium]|nr:Mur ligase family protein [Candidatus Omnitrophota bacterium]
MVLETGLGGRLDATNVVNPLVCAITPISYEHTQKLGNTLRKIAREKAGIIKKSPKSVAYSLQLAVVSAPQVKEAAEVIWKKCREEGLKLYEIGKDIDYKKTKSGFKVKGMLREYKDLKVKLLGEHQLINATLAVAAVEGLSSYGVKVGVDSIRKGLYNTIWPGRCEIIAKNPYIVLDGAQNIASAAVLRKAVKENFIYKKLILILGVSSDKDIQGICNELYGLADKVILTKADTSRATTPEILAKYFQGKEIQIRKNIKEAKNLALRIAKKEDLILVTGSLFVVGEFRNAKK